MAPSILLLVPSLFALLFLMVPSHCIVDTTTSTTLAISQATRSVCGIMAGSQHHSIQCARFPVSANSTDSFPIEPTISFDSMTGGHNFICGLRSGDSSFFCWDGIGEPIKRVYPGPMALRQFSAGARHVAAIDGDQMRIRWWRFGCDRHTKRCRHFPKSVSGMYHSLTSGDVFTCALNVTNNVHCWGPRARPIQRKFDGVQMRSLTAGGGRMCGLNETGHLMCTRDQPNVQSGEAFEFTSLAIGSSQTCAITRKNGSVVCWGRHGLYFPADSTSFEFLVAGGDLTCGLTTDSFNVACWSLNGRNSSAVILSLSKILPGVCVPDLTFCSCGVYPDSVDMCGGSGVICKKSGTGAESCQFSPPIIEQGKDDEWKKKRRLWLAYAIFGPAYGLICVAFVLVLWYEERRKERKKVNQDESNFLANRNAPPPVFPDMENVRVFTFKELKTATNKFHRKLGSGGFGRVFQGQLSDNRLVAVKRCKNHPTMDMEAAFRSEVETLSEARHENVVNLIGYCTERNQRLLVFEFMSRGDLYSHIHPRNGKIPSPLFSSWRLRVKVLLDVARGIKHLHYAERRIIHRDIKTENILINENWVAKICDFGMALFGPGQHDNHVVIDLPVGTAGYADPECNDDNLRASQRNDIYGFGVVMLEVLSGRMALDGTTQLAEFAAPMCRQDRLMELLDGRLAVPQGQEWEAVYRVAVIARECVRTPGRRPNMNFVTATLADALSRFDQSGS